LKANDHSVAPPLQIEPASLGFDDAVGRKEQQDPTHNKPQAKNRPPEFSPGGRNALFPDQLFSDFVNVSRSYCQDDIAGRCGPSQRFQDLIKAVEIHRVSDQI